MHFVTVSSSMCVTGYTSMCVSLSLLFNFYVALILTLQLAAPTNPVTSVELEMFCLLILHDVILLTLYYFID